MKKREKNFRSRIYLACQDDFLRPAFNNVYFKDGFAYATNSHIIIKQHLSIHDFTEEEIKMMDGKMMNKKLMMEIYKWNYISVEKDCIYCKTNHLVARYYFVAGDPFSFPNTDAIFKQLKPEAECEPITKIGVNLALANLFSRVFIHDRDKQIGMYFNSEKRGIKVVSVNISEDKQVGVLMPLLLDNEY